MSGREGRFKIVADRLAPHCHRLGQSGTQRVRGLLRRNSGVSLGSTDVQVRVNYHTAGTRQVQVDFFEYVPLFYGQHGLIPNEEGAIGTQAAGVIFQRFSGKTQAEQIIGGFQRKSGIGGATAQARANGHDFVQVKLGRRQLRKIGLQQLVGPHAKVGCRGAGNGATGEHDAGFGLAGGGGQNFQDISPGQGQKHRFETVEAVGAAFGDVEAEVELSVGKDEHFGSFED